MTAPSGQSDDVLILLDEPLELDRRVQFFIDRYRVRRKSVHFLDVLNSRSDWSSPLTVWIAGWQTIFFFYVHLLRHIPVTAGRVRALLRTTPTKAYDAIPLFAYPAISLVETLWVYFRGAISRPRLRGYRVLHANDLRCLIFAVAAAGNDTRIIYDSHEFNPFRNRPRMSWLRLIANSAFEAACIKRAQCVLTVSDPIASAFRSLYGCQQVVVLENRFFQGGPGEPVRMDDKPSTAVNLIYFGSLAPGRGLKLFNELAKHPDIAAVAIAFGGNTERARRTRQQLSAVTIIDQKPYEPLRISPGALAGKAFSWGVLEDVCLSYTYALPNKFFQSLALGLPVIAARGTYLGDLVGQAGAGVVIDATTSADALIDKLKGIDAREYAAMRASVKSLAQRFCSPSLEQVADRCIDAVLKCDQVAIGPS